MTRLETVKINRAPRVADSAAISLPSYHDCLALMAAHGMLPNIREHSYRVMQVAERLGQALAAGGLRAAPASDQHRGLAPRYRQDRLPGHH